MDTYPHLPRLRPKLFECPQRRIFLRTCTPRELKAEVFSSYSWSPGYPYEILLEYTNRGDGVPLTDAQHWRRKAEAGLMHDQCEEDWRTPHTVPEWYGS